MLIASPLFRFTRFVFLFTVLSACSIAQVTRPVVKIALVAPFEGQYRYVGYDAIYAARLALRDANAAGGVAGYSVELVAFDDRGTVDGARTAARNLSMDSQVVSVVGHYQERTTEAARALYGQAELPVMVAGTIEGQTDRQSDVLCVMLRYLEGSRQLAVDDDAMFRIQWVTDDLGAELVCGDEMSVTASSQILPLPSVDVILLTSDPVEAGEAVKALREVGWDGIVAGGPTLGSPLFAEVADPGGAFFASPYRWPDTLGRDADFAASYQSLGPHVPPPGVFAVTTYQATQALLEAIEATVREGETPTRKTLLQHVIQPSLTAVYLYQWTPTGAPKLIKQENIALDRQSSE
jgi:branched-chain amino acid transport system substrate-binding protein